MRKAFVSILVILGFVLTGIGFITSPSSASNFASSVKPNVQYDSDTVYCPDATDYGVVTMNYKGHVTATVRNAAGDYGQKDYFYNDGHGGYGQLFFLASKRIHGHYITGSGEPTDPNDTFEDIQNGSLYAGCSAS